MSTPYVIPFRHLLREEPGSLVVTDRTSGRAHELTGVAADAVRAVVAKADITAFDPGVLDVLVANGVLAVRDQALLPRVTRREALAAAAAVGVTTVALPRAAAAASTVGSEGTGGEGEGGGAYSSVDFRWDPITGNPEEWSAEDNTDQDGYDGQAPILTAGFTGSRASVVVPEGHDYMEVYAIGGPAPGFERSVGTVFARFMVKPGDTIQAVVGESAAGGGGTYSTNDFDGTGGDGGRGLGVYRQGLSATTGTWIVIAGGAGGAGGASTYDEYARGGFPSLLAAEANGRPQEIGDLEPPFLSPTFDLSGKGGIGAIGSAGTGGAGGAAGANGGNVGSAGSSGSATLGTDPMSLAAGGNGGAGGSGTGTSATTPASGSVGGSGGGSGYRGGGGGGGSGSGGPVNFVTRYGGGGGAGASYVNESIGDHWSYVAGSAQYGSDSPWLVRVRIYFYVGGFPD